MKRLLVAIAMLAFTTPVFAKDITITLNDQEQKILITLLDAALKQGGLNQLQAVSQFVQKIQKAAAPDAVSAPSPDKPK
jgi:hypothetical protein